MHEQVQEEAEVPEEVHEVQDGGLKKLKFKQQLVGRPGKQVGVGDLLTRLKTLLDELRTIDQEEAHRESLMPVAESLAHHSLLQHKDNGVRAWTVCCIVDMLKLFAPDAPYPASKLRVGYLRRPTLEPHANKHGRRSSPSSSTSCCPSSPTPHTHTTASTCTYYGRWPNGRASCS